MFLIYFSPVFKLKTIAIKAVLQNKVNTVTFMRSQKQKTDWAEQQQKQRKWSSIHNQTIGYIQFKEHPIQTKTTLQN